MALTVTEQAYFDHAKGALPRFLFQLVTASLDVLGGYAAMMGDFDTQVTEWLTEAYIKTSTGIWLDQHARDYATTRRASETDIVLRARIGLSKDVVVANLLLSQTNAILSSAGYPATAVMVELRRDKAFLSDTTAGGTRAFLSRGYRCGSLRPYGFVVILPYPTNLATADAVYEYLRQAKAAGFRHYVERRQIP